MALLATVLEYGLGSWTARQGEDEPTKSRLLNKHSFFLIEAVEHGAWRYSVFVNDQNVDGWEEGDYWVEKSVGPPRFLFSLSVRFPHRDHEIVLRRVRGASDDILGKRIDVKDLDACTMA